MIEFEDMYYELKGLGFEVYSRRNDEEIEEIVMTDGKAVILIVGCMITGILLTYDVIE